MNIRPAVQFAILILATVGTTTSLETFGDEFVLRKVSSLGNSTFFGPYATPIGVIDNYLLFAASTSGNVLLYRTDGSHVDLVSNSVTIGVKNLEIDPFVDTAKLGSELYFPATGQHGQELFASDGSSIRQVADLASGTSSSNPYDLETINNQVLFQAVDFSFGPGKSQIFHTDGTTTGNFALQKNEALNGSAQINGLLIFNGSAPGGGAGKLYSTDGQALNTISIPGSGAPSEISRAGNWAYFFEGALYRTDGLTADRLGSIDDFLPGGSLILHTSFELQGNFYFMANESNTAATKAVIFRTAGGTPAEVLRTPGNQGFGPLTFQFSDGNRAFFTLGTTLVANYSNLMAAAFDSDWRT